MWTQSTSVTDRHTDGQTDRQTDRIKITKTVQRIASHGKNEVISAGPGCVAVCQLINQSTFVFRSFSAQLSIIGVIGRFAYSIGRIWTVVAG